MNLKENQWALGILVVHGISGVVVQIGEKWGCVKGRGVEREKVA